MSLIAFITSSLLLLLPALAQSSCSTTLTPANSVKPSIASGYHAQLVATGLSSPRSIQFDTEGNLLVVEAGRGAVSAYSFDDQGGTCLSVSGNTTVVSTGSVGSFIVGQHFQANPFCSSIMVLLFPVTVASYMHRRRRLPPHGIMMRQRSQLDP